MKKGSIAIIITVVVAVIIGAVGVLGYQKFVAKPKTSNTTVQQVNSTSNKTETSPIPSVSSETANLKTFRSSSGRFTTKYPNSWSEIHTGDTASSAEDVSFGPGIKSPTEDLNIKAWIQVQKNHGPNGTAVYPSAKTYVDASFKSAKDSPIFLTNKIDEVEVDGIKGFKLTNSYTNGFINTLIAVDKNDFTYVISGKVPKDVDQVLSTFKFD